MRALVPWLVNMDADKAERQRLKKKRRAAELQAQEAAAAEEPAEEEDEAAAQRKAAKKAEKKRRREEAAAAAAMADDAHDAPEAAAPGEKRPKTKREHAAPGGHNDPPRAALAAVGDKSAATTGALFKKDFFIESPALAAMSQSVRSRRSVACAVAALPLNRWRHVTAQEALKHREKLQITVEKEPSGAIYKPVRSFDEAGFPPNVLAACR